MIGFRAFLLLSLYVLGLSIIFVFKQISQDKDRSVLMENQKIIQLRLNNIEERLKR
jgi:hypothetical protein